jgi:hypothetical protein
MRIAPVAGIDISKSFSDMCILSPDNEIYSVLHFDHTPEGMQTAAATLHNKREQLNKLILNVTKSITAMKGEITMTDHEKFEGFKQTLIDENERKYGAEIRSKYGDDAIDESNAKLKGLTQVQHDESVRLCGEIEETLKAAFDTGNPASELAQKACGLHRQWLCIMYPRYNKDYHKGLGEMYVADERFRAYYDKIAPGCTEFLRDAINIYCGK